MALYDLSTTIIGTPTYNAGNAKFGSLGFSGAGIRAADGVDDFLSSTGANGGALTTGTIEAWIKLSPAGALKVFLSHPGWWYLGVDAAGKGFFEYGWGAGTSTGLTGTSTLTDGNWHHVAGVLTSGAGSLYVDGTREATSAQTRNAVGMDGTKYFVVGTHTNNASSFLWPGSIDEVRVSTTARYTGTSYTVPAAEFTPDGSMRALYHLEGSGANTPRTTVTLKNREAGAWVTRTAEPKYWNGSAWVTKRPKRWNGTAWVDLV